MKTRRDQEDAQDEGDATATSAMRTGPAHRPTGQPVNFGAPSALSSPGDMTKFVEATILVTAGFPRGIVERLRGRGDSEEASHPGGVPRLDRMDRDGDGEDLLRVEKRGLRLVRGDREILEGNGCLQELRLVLGRPLKLNVGRATAALPSAARSAVT